MKRSRFYPLLAVGLLAAGAAAYSLGVLLRPAPDLYGTQLENPPLVTGVTLENSRLGTTHLGDFGGKLVLVFFGYTNCPDVCPLTLSRLAKVYRDLGEPQEVKVIMITVDPARDTPEVVQRYAASFHPDFLGLSGSADLIAAAAKTFFTGYQQLPDGLVSHTDMVALVDRTGHLRRVYRQDRVLKLAHDLPILLARR